MEFDPYEAASSLGDTGNLESWTKFQASLEESVFVAVPPAPFLMFSEGPFGPDGPPQDVLDRSIATIANVYETSFTESFSQHTQSANVDSRPYVPPALYGKGGAISAPYEIVELIRDIVPSIDIARDVFISLIASAVLGRQEEANIAVSTSQRSDRLKALSCSFSVRSAFYLRDSCT